MDIEDKSNLFPQQDDRRASLHLCKTLSGEIVVARVIGVVVCCSTVECWDVWVSGLAGRLVHTVVLTLHCHCPYSYIHICFSLGGRTCPRSTTWRPTWGCSSLRASPSTRPTPQTYRYVSPHATNKHKETVLKVLTGFEFGCLWIDLWRQPFSDNFLNVETKSTCWWLHKWAFFEAFWEGSG